MNKDLIFELDRLITLYEPILDIEFKHVRAHRSEPQDKDSIEHKIWYFNMKADELARKGSLISKLSTS